MDDMTEIKIDKGIPLAKSGRSRIYPFADMEVGDSFAVPDDLGRHPKGGSIRQKRISASANIYIKRKKPGAKFATRRMVKDGQPVVRCWRVA